MKRLRFAGVISISVLLISTFGAGPARAEDGKNPDAWQFEITPYLFASGLNGTVGMRGVNADVDMSFGDIWDRLDKAFMLLATAQKGDWIFGFDGMYVDLADEKASSWQGPLGNSNTAQLNADLTEQIYSLSAGRQVLAQGRGSRLDLLGVARYTSLESTLKLALTTGSDLLPDGSRSVSDKYDWWDAAVGLRFIAPLATKWDFVGYADVGAGGSDLTYQLLAGVNWQFSKALSAKVGYRYLYQDYEKDDFKWDMAMSGAFLGLGIRF